MLKIENWAVVTISPYSPPEMGFCFSGFIYGHPSYDDGTSVRTSVIMSYDGKYFCAKSGSKYILGNVNPDYENEFPNAYDRILKSFSKDE